MEQLSEKDKAVLDVIFDPLQLKSSSLVSDEPEDEVSDRIQDPEVIDLVNSAIQTAEAGDLDQALKLFDTALEKAPNSSSILNNRAQALRLAGRVDEALRNLNQAVEASKGQGKSGSKALCQRAIIHRLQGREDEAKSDFELAAKHSAFARSQLVNMNPYAAMCNAMLKEMTAKLSESKTSL